MVSLARFLFHPNFLLLVQIAHSGNVSSVTVLIISCGWELHRQHPHQEAPATLTATAAPLESSNPGQRAHHTLHQTHQPLHQSHAPRVHFSPNHCHYQVPRGAGLPSWASCSCMNLRSPLRNTGHVTVKHSNHLSLVLAALEQL